MFLRRLHAVSIFLIPDRRPEALVSILTLVLQFGFSAPAILFATKLGEDIFKHLGCVHADFDEQKPVHLSAGAPNSFTTKALHPG